MTTGHDSLAVRLAADICGPATGNPFEDAMRELVLVGAARIGEMGETGFDTDTPFANVDQAQYVGEGRVPFLLVSLGTNTTYFVFVMERVGASLRVAIKVNQEGEKLSADNFRMMTLTRKADGNVHAAAGW